MDSLNPQVWYGERELNFLPPHFIKASTPLNNESYFWVKSKLIGRFSIYASTIRDSITFLDLRPHIFFEDPKEVTLYELRWAGAK